MKKQEQSAISSNKPIYEVPQKDFQIVQNYQQKITCKTVYIPFSGGLTSETVQFNLGIEDTLPKKVKILDVQSTATTNPVNMFQLDLPGICNFSIFIADNTQTRGLVAEFSNFNNIQSGQTAVLQSVRTNTASAANTYVTATFLFYY